MSRLQANLALAAFALAIALRTVRAHRYRQVTRDSFATTLARHLARTSAMFLLIAFVLGVGGLWLVGAFCSRYGLVDFAPTIVRDLVVVEVTPLAVGLFLAFTLSAQMGAEAGAMVANGELSTLHAFGIDVHDVFTVPRVAASLVYSLVLTLGFLWVILLANDALPLIAALLGTAYVAQDLAGATGFGDLVQALSKAAAFGFFAALLPLFRAFHGPGLRGRMRVPGGLDRVFGVIVIIEALSLLLRYT